ncbi:MAG: hypothetical protein EU533_02175 [Promethearchaeota archaeon]|nr:MAG: hypothetical protein EU533_02175 [Candidatus Lokiarchaeota archaeon]
MKKIIKRILITLSFAFLSLIIVSAISFIISRWFPGDPVLPYLPEGTFTSEEYEAIRHQLGLDQPIIIQYFIYLFNMLSGVWGYSISISPENFAFFLIIESVPKTIFLLILPIFLGLILGFLLGDYSLKFDSRKANRILQIISILGFVIPIGLLTLSYQIFLILGNPIVELVILWIPLTISIMALTVLLSRMYLINLFKGGEEKRSAIIFVLLIGITYGILYGFLIRIEMTYSFGGIGELLYHALVNADFYVINGIIFLTLGCLPVFIIFVLFSFYLLGVNKMAKK